ncbi:MAG: rhodanese-like domain-containing protein [Bacteroidota bacterium]
MDNCKINRWQLLKSKLNNLSPEEFKQALESTKGAILVDCRTPDEFKFSRIKGAINFNYLTQHFVEEMENLDPSNEYFVYCRSERRSLRTCTLLKNGGFAKVYNLEGGLQEWISAFGEDSLDRS